MIRTLYCTALAACIVAAADAAPRQAPVFRGTGEAVHVFVTVTDRDGKQIRGTVVYIQPKKERWRVDHAIVHLTTNDWLDPYRYEAIYS